MHGICQKICFGWALCSILGAKLKAAFWLIDFMLFAALLVLYKHINSNGFIVTMAVRPK
jgi:hypothetical protein